MRRNRKWTRCCAMLLSGSLAVGLTLSAMPSGAQDNDEAKDAAFAEKFWNYLQESDYQEKWSRWPGHEEEFKESESARHGALLKVYVNEEAKSNPGDPPVKSIIVKENYNEEKELVAITPMYRVGKNYDPEHKDWYWAKHKPDGTLFEMQGMKLSGKVEGCIRCHGSAKGNDFIFSNDE